MCGVVVVVRLPPRQRVALTNGSRRRCLEEKRGSWLWLSCQSLCCLLANADWLLTRYRSIRCCMAMASSNHLCYRPFINGQFDWLIAYTNLSNQTGPALSNGMTRPDQAQVTDLLLPRSGQVRSGLGQRLELRLGPGGGTRGGGQGNRTPPALVRPAPSRRPRGGWPAVDYVPAVPPARDLVTPSGRW